MCYNKIMSTAQHSTAQHSTAQHSTALISSSIGLFFQHFQYPLNFLSSSLSKFIIDLKIVSIVLLKFILFVLMQIYLVITIPFNQKQCLHSTSKSELKTLVNSICLITVFFSVLLLTTTVNSANALSATTVNTIQGTAPNLKPDAAKYLGFNVGTRPVVFYNEINGKLKTTYFDSALTFEDFIPQPLADTLYYDADGDISKSTESIVSTPVLPIMEWYDANETLITADSYKKNIGCSQEFEEPFKLIITAKNVVVTSEYGDPDTNTIGDISNTYEIKVKPQICGYKTNDIIVNEAQQWIDTAGNWHGTNYSSSVVTTPEYSVSPYRGGGFWDAFVPGLGFNGKPGGQSGNFPQTGFAGAKYKIIVSGTKSAANYSFSVTSLSVPGAITVDSDGFVMLHKNPKGAAKIGITKSTFNLTHSIWMPTWAK